MVRIHFNTQMGPQKFAGFLIFSIPTEFAEGFVDLYGREESESGRDEPKMFVELNVFMLEPGIPVAVWNGARHPWPAFKEAESLK